MDSTIRRSIGLARQISADLEKPRRPAFRQSCAQDPAGRPEEPSRQMRREEDFTRIALLQHVGFEIEGMGQGVE
jgi:hypothetical protein